MAQYPQSANAVATTAATLPHGSMINVSAGVTAPAAYNQFSSFPSQAPMQTPPMSYPSQSPQSNLQQQHHLQQPHQMHQMHQMQQSQQHFQQPQQFQQPQHQPQQLQQPQQHQEPRSQPQQHPMAAPPVPFQASNATPAKLSGPQAQTPSSPDAQQRERERVSLLLEINKELLQETMNLQAQGKGGSVGQPRPSQQQPAAGGDDNNKEGNMSKPASKEFIE